MKLKNIALKLIGGALLLPLAFAAHAADVEVTGKTLTFAIPTDDNTSQVVCQLTTKSNQTYVNNEEVTEMYRGTCYVHPRKNNKEQVRTRIAFRQFSNKPTEFKFRTELPRGANGTNNCRITGKIDKDLKRNSSQRELNFVVSSVRYVCGPSDQGTSLSASEIKRKTKVDPQLSVKIRS
jgi:hypothetical protein